MLWTPESLVLAQDRADRSGTSVLCALALVFVLLTESFLSPRAVNILESLPGRCSNGRRNQEGNLVGYFLMSHFNRPLMIYLSFS